jgi:hypothetical protein
MPYTSFYIRLDRSIVEEIQTDSLYVADKFQDCLYTSKSIISPARC